MTYKQTIGTFTHQHALLSAVQRSLAIGENCSYYELDSTAPSLLLYYNALGYARGLAGPFCALECIAFSYEGTPV